MLTVSGPRELRPYRFEKPATGHPETAPRLLRRRPSPLAAARCRLPAFLALAYAAALAASAPSQAGGVEWTPRERAWLAAHPRLSLSVDDGYAPKNFRDANGEIAGVNIDFVRLIERRLGVAIDLVGSNWDQALAKAMAHEVDGVVNADALESRKRRLAFTDVYAVHPQALVVGPEDAAAATLADMAGRSVAVKRSASQARHLRQSHPEIHLVYVNTVEEGLKRLIEGKADGVFDDLAVLQDRIMANFYSTLRVAAVVKSPPTGYARIGLRNDEPMLPQVFNKAIASITSEDRRRIYGNWFGAEALDKLVEEDAPAISLTAEEKAFLEAHPVLRVGVDPNYAPVEYRDGDGRYKGLAMDYLEAVGKLVGVDFEYGRGSTWTEQMRLGRAGEIDFFTALQRTPEREADFRFTKPYLSLPVVSFARRDTGYLGRLDQLDKPARIAVVAGYATEEWARTDFPDHKIVAAATISKAIALVREGDCLAYVGDILTTSNYLRESGRSEIVVAGETPRSYQLAFAARSSAPQLASLLDRALEAIPDAERNRIYQKWVAYHPAPPIDYGLLWRVAGTSGLLVGLILYWNRKLAAQIAQRRQAESVLRSALELSQAPADEEPTLQAALDAARSHPKIVAGFFGLFCPDADTGNPVFCRLVRAGAGLEVSKVCAAASGTAFARPCYRFAAGCPLPVPQASSSGLAESWVADPSGEREWLAACVRWNGRPVAMLGVARLAGTNTWRCQEQMRLLAETAWNSIQRQRSEAQLAANQQLLERQVAKRTKELKARNRELQEEIETRRAMEARLREAKAEAEAASQAKDEFLAVVSHELRTPLNPIVGYTSLMLEENASEPVRSYLEAIHDSGLLMTRLVGQILEFSKLSRGKIEPRKRPFDLGKVLRQARETAALDSNGNEVRFTSATERRLKNGPPLRFAGDEQLVAQVVGNLLGNATKFTRQGVVAIDLQIEPANEASGASLARIAVSDTGIGISPDDLERIFKPFTQADFSSTRAYGGLGLGLAICQRVASALGGTLQARSELGKGSQFVLSISLDPALEERETAAPSALPPPASSPNEGAPPRLLIAEDSPANLDYALKLAASLGAVCVSADRGDAALRLAETEPPFDLILLDINMPGLNGIDTAKAIRRLPGRRGRAPIIVMTADATFATKSKLERLPVDGYLVKPVLPSAFRDAVTAAAGG